MRIVAGTRKSIPLKAVPGDLTRPTTDKVKESVFNILGPYLDGEMVLDLFAGSGGLGLEALSRGAKESVFIEKNPKAVTVLQENIAKARFQEESLVIRGDAKRAIEQLKEGQKKFDLVFLDPPYAQTKLYDLAELLIQMDLVADGAILVVEHEKSVQVEENIPSAELYRTEKYGSLCVSFFTYTADDIKGEIIS